MLEEQTKNIDITVEVIPEQYRKMAGPDAPERARSMVAAGLLPMPTEALVASLCYLVKDPNPELSSKATETLLELDQEILIGMATTSLFPSLLDVLADLTLNRQKILEQILTNRNTDDQTFIKVAKTGKGRALGLISHNTVRIIRTPEIAKSLYFNVEAPMIAVSTALEACVRNDVDISSLPGHKEIIESIMGVAQAIPEDLVEEVAENAEDIAAESFNEILREVGNENTKSVSATRVTFQMLQEMSVSQKVRLALVGNAALRAQLISDARSLVSMAVLKSPKLTDKEVAVFAGNKALSDQVIRTIAGRRDWVKKRAVKAALVLNPKTPARYALSFLSFLSDKELKGLRKNKEIPSYVTQAAIALISKREKKH